MAFNADLNPKKSGMELGELLKMEDAIAKNKFYSDAAKAKSMQKTVTPAANSILSNLKSSMDDQGVPFKFGNNYQKD
jgi:hypothetical protein